MKLPKRRQANLPERRRHLQDNSTTSESTIFRRGRTLTGSASSLVKTISESSADLKSTRVQAHELTKKRRNLTRALVGVCLVGLGLLVMIDQFIATPVVKASPDSSTQLEAIYAETIDDYLSMNLSERWRVLTDEGKLTSYMRSEVPEVESVKVTGSAGFGKSLFEIAFREPIASWNVNDRQIYVDSTGVTFNRNYFKAPQLRIIDQSGIDSTPSGQSVISNRFMGYIGQVIGQLEEKGYSVASITIPEGMTRQIEVQVNGVDYPFKLSSDRPAGEAVEDMVRSIEWMKSRSVKPEYVDVRVRGKAFYR